MEKKKAAASVDDLAIIKAAAWAWYQHGLKCEGRPIREFDLARTRRLPRPSRYKLEVMRDADWPIAATGSNTLESQGPVIGPCHTNISLLDSYEMNRISSEFNCVLNATCTISNSSNGHPRDSGHRTPNVASSSSSSSSERGTIAKKLAWKLNGFWLRHAMGICGSREEMVETSVLQRQSRRKQRSVAGLGNYYS